MFFAGSPRQNVAGLALETTGCQKRSIFEGGAGGGAGLMRIPIINPAAPESTSPRATKPP